MSEDASPGRWSSASSSASAASAAGGGRPRSHEAREDSGCRIRSAPACADSPPQRCSRSRRCSAFGRGGYFGVAARPGAILACAAARVAALVGRAAAPALSPRAARAGRPRRAHGLDRAVAAWAPMGGPAFDDFERLVALPAAFARRIALLRDVAWVEPVLLAGIVAAALYGLSERLLPPRVLAPGRSRRRRPARPAADLLERGALAAIGLVLAAGLASRGSPRGRRGAGDRPRPVPDVLPRRARRRPRRARCPARAAPTQATLRAVLVTGVAAGLAAVAALALPGVADVDGSSVKARR